MRLKCTVAYDGSGFNGWQKQPHGRSVQTTLEAMLAKMHKHAVKVVGAGRTDAGVHALGQVFHFDTPLALPIERWLIAMNTNLPEDIRILEVSPVSDLFHARFDAVSKVYRYQINIGEYNLFERNIVYQLNKSVDIETMKVAATQLLGTHDFTSFNATPLEVIDDQTKTIYAIDISEDEHRITITIHGSGFLRYMVRMIVGTLLECGRHRLPINAIQYALVHPDKQSLKYNVPACGLTLVKVNY